MRSGTRRRTRLDLAACALIYALSGPWGARQARADSLTLDRVVQTTLSINPDIRLASQQAESARGALLASRAPFDFTLESSAAGARTHTVDAGGQDALRKQLTYSAGATRLFRNGLSLEPDLTLRRTSLSTFPGSAATNDASVALSLRVPLLRDRGGSASAAPERAATLDYESSLLGLRHATAQRVLGAVVAYWDYLAALRREEVLRDSEARSQQTAEQTRVLVEAEERTSADLTQIRGNLASKTVSRIAAEQAVVDARQALGLAVGLPAEEIDLLPPGATDFPGVPTGMAPPVAAALAARALEARADFQAAERDLLASEAVVAGARSELRPRLDLALGTGYSATEPGLGVGNFFGPLWRREPKLDASFALSYAYPSGNSRARGRLLQSAAAAEQQRILRDDLRRRIASSVAVSVQALTRGAAGVLESEQAVELTRATVHAEQRKFQLGVSTLFDVIQAEDGLTSALLSRIQSQRTYAVAIATLRFQTGLLLGGASAQPAVELDGLLTPP